MAAGSIRRSPGIPGASALLIPKPQARDQQIVYTHRLNLELLPSPANGSG